MNYQEYMKAREEGISALPIFYAFSVDQFAEGMARFGLKPTDTDKIYRLGDTGGYYPKDRADEVRAFFDDNKLSELMKDSDFAFEAFYCEMGNHEYHINYYQGDWEVLGNFYNVEWLGDSADHMDYLNSIDGITNTEKKAYLDARRKFLKDAEENGWY